MYIYMLICIVLHLCRGCRLTCGLGTTWDHGSAERDELKGQKSATHAMVRYDAITVLLTEVLIGHEIMSDCRETLAHLGYVCVSGRVLM